VFLAVCRDAEKLGFASDSFSVVIRQQQRCSADQNGVQNPIYPIFMPFHAAEQRSKKLKNDSAERKRHSEASAFWEQRKEVPQRGTK
jgi:hypothetical protein